MASWPEELKYYIIKCCFVAHEVNSPGCCYRDFPTVRSPFESQIMDLDLVTLFARVPHVLQNFT